MKIGIVLSRPPSYSETFFNSKLKGLMSSGFKVILFVQQNDPSFTLCRVRTGPRVYRKNLLFQCITAIQICFRLLARPKHLYNFMLLERRTGRSWLQLLKNTYSNAHILISKVDWLHFGFTTLALQSEHVAKAINAKMAVSCRGFDLDVYPLKYKNVYDLIWAQVDKVHVISNYMLDRARQSGMSPKTPYTLITPAIQLRKNKTPRILNKQSKLRFLTVARLHWIKGLVDTLEALALLKHRGVTFEYRVIGEGAEAEELKFAVHQLGLTQEVTFLGRLPHDIIIDELAMADVYIQYSHSEGFCNALLEAQAMGCICVASDGGGLPENVVHEQTGWVVAKRKPLELARALEKVIGLPAEELQKVRVLAMQRVAAHFNLEKQREAFVRFYE